MGTPVPTSRWDECYRFSVRVFGLFFHRFKQPKNRRFRFSAQNQRFRVPVIFDSVRRKPEISVQSDTTGDEPMFRTPKKLRIKIEPEPNPAPKSFLPQSISPSQDISHPEKKH